MHAENGFSIIVPTYKEVKNIPLLITRIANLNFTQFELIIVDDNSLDGTFEIINQFKKKYPWLKLFIREQQPSLSKAVMIGIHLAQFPDLIIMDADLSHPPEKIPEMLTVLHQPHIDMVIGSRYIAGGSTDKSWSWKRRISSKIAALITQLIVFTKVKDPLSGFFGIKKERCDGVNLQPLSWKISLEIMIKCRCNNVREIPIHFAERQQGQSKMNLGVIYHFMRHIHHLLFYKIFLS